ncbi:helix-turn-helix domain-containing protein [Brachybacterium massiliense]|uniref:helix-turn-helix domain-containing protein n=1 Tax=Brachybacterium massiliense TaxID=1755098 RepID=UPI001483838A|nr:helix-turn-helix domain-containing protein [Brachybacterium massiliense]
MTTGPDLERLGRAIRLYRDITNLTQDEIATRGGPSDVTIRGLENGNGKKPNGATLRKIDRGLRWPEGFAAKLLSGDAELYEDIDPEGGRVPSFMDFTADPMRDALPPSDEDMEASHAAWIAERPIYEQSTADLITELAGRYREQQKRIQQLEEERTALLARVDSLSRPSSAPNARLSVLRGNVSHDEREELYRRAEQVDLSREPFAAVDPEDTSDDDEPV